MLFLPAWVRTRGLIITKITKYNTCIWWLTVNGITTQPSPLSTDFYLHVVCHSYYHYRLSVFRNSPKTKHLSAVSIFVRQNTLTGPRLALMWLWIANGWTDWPDWQYPISCCLKTWQVGWVGLDEKCPCLYWRSTVTHINYCTTRYGYIIKVWLQPIQDLIQKIMGRFYKLFTIWATYQWIVCSIFSEKYVSLTNSHNIFDAHINLYTIVVVVALTWLTNISTIQHLNSTSLTKFQT